MTGNISGPFTGHGYQAVPVTPPPKGNPRVRETRITITEDQASRLRAMMEAMQGRRHLPPVVPEAAPPAPPVPTPPAPVRVPPPPQVAASAPVRTAKVVTISSGKGGVGKTSASVNLAIALSQLGRRVSLLDADLGMANADVLCGLMPTRRLEQFVGVSDQSTPGLPQTLPLTELAINAPGGFRLIPGSVGIARMTELSAPERDRLMAALAELDQSSDLIIVDTGAGLGREVINFSRAADLSLVIATPEPTSIADAYALMKCILRVDRQKARDLRPNVPVGGEGHESPKIRLVLNQVSGLSEAEAVHARIAAVCQRFLNYRLPLLGWIPQDPAVALSVRKRKPLLVADATSPAAARLRALGAAVATELRIQFPAGAPVRASGGGLSGLLSRVLRGR